MIPKQLRKTKYVIMVQAALYPLLFLMDNFFRYRAAKEYQLLITTQVCYLTRLLNDRFDFTDRRITIGDAEKKEPIFLYQQEEEKPVYFSTEDENSPVYLYTKNEAGEFSDDFVVNVPSAVVFDEDEMASLLNSYILFGTHYKIVVV